MAAFLIDDFCHIFSLVFCVVEQCYMYVLFVFCSFLLYEFVSVCRPMCLI